MLSGMPVAILGLMPGTSAKTRTRFTIWLALALGAVCAIVLRDISRLLGTIQNSAHEAYTAAVLTKPRLNPGDGTTEIANAWLVWAQSSADRDFLVGAHLSVDFVYIAVYGFLL